MRSHHENSPVAHDRATRPSRDRGRHSWNRRTATTACTRMPSPAFVITRSGSLAATPCRVWTSGTTSSTSLCSCSAGATDTMIGVRRSRHSPTGLCGASRHLWRARRRRGRTNARCCRSTTSCQLHGQRRRDVPRPDLGERVCLVDARRGGARHCRPARRSCAVLREPAAGPASVPRVAGCRRRGGGDPRRPASLLFLRSTRAPAGASDGLRPRRISVRTTPTFCVAGR